MRTSLTPLFIFSMPRSGSTLLQRLLSTHAEVATVSEPWLLLPLLGTFSPERMFADYAHHQARQALDDLCRAAGGGREVYRQEVRRMVLSLYRRASVGEPRYFLDKTPRYHLIIDEILETFPDAKVVFLFRHPLAVAASLSNSFLEGSWDLSLYNIDLYHGAVNLVDGVKDHGEGAFVLRYEDLVVNPRSVIEPLFDYLELEPPPDAESRFSEVALAGTYGDKVGTSAFERISAAPLDRWKRSIFNPLRRRWCKRYLEWLGKERLRCMGYEHDEIAQELAALEVTSRGLPGDVASRCVGKVKNIIEPRIARKKLRLWRADHRRGLFAHR